MTQNQRQPTAEELKSPRFHHEQKGCKIWFGYYSESREYVLSQIDEILGIDVQRASLFRGKCRNHRVIVCHCGWRRGWYSDWTPTTA